MAPAPTSDRLILASASPRRLALLQQIGVQPAAVAPVEIDERPSKAELPASYVRRLAQAKLDRALPQHPGCFLLAADTAVACGRRILPKAETIDQARSCLALLSGRNHRVFGGIAVAAPDGRRALKLVETRVSFKRLSDREAEAYLSSGEWQGKAGGYAIQGKAAQFVISIHGSYSNVVGLALYETAQMLAGLGFEL